MRMKASVIICTYNRIGLLKEAIESIRTQDFPISQFEIVVVDNNSKDSTARLIKEIANTSSVKIKYVFEGRQGLSHARNAGISKAEGEIIAFTDDDIEADKAWLRELVSAFDSPDVYCAGGPLRPVWLTERPEWLTERWQGYFAVNEFTSAHESGEFKWPNYPWGANTAYRRQVFTELGQFSTDLGRKGKCLLSNEEINLCRKIEQSGKRIRFVPGAVIHHKISPERMKKQWLYHRTYWQGRSDALLYQNTFMDIYANLRTHASLSLRREVERRESEFDIKCGLRAAKGYLHQLLLSDIKGTSNFKRVRVLETFIQELIRTTGRLVADRDNTLTGLRSAVEARDKDVRDKNLLLVERDEKLKVLGPLDEKLRRLEESIKVFGQFRQYEDHLRQKDQDIKNKDEALKRKDEASSVEKQRLDEVVRQKEDKITQLEGMIREKDEALSVERQRLDEVVRQKEDKITQLEGMIREKDEALSVERQRLDEVVRQKEEQITQLEGMIREKDSQFRQKCEELIEVDNNIKAKCIEVVTKDQELMKACDERSAEKQRLEAELRKRDEMLKHYEKAISDFQRVFKEREKLETQIAQRNNTIEEIRNSMSWKITAPLRIVYGILRRHGK